MDYCKSLTCPIGQKMQRHFKGACINKKYSCKYRFKTNSISFWNCNFERKNYYCWKDSHKTKKSSWQLNFAGSIWSKSNQLINLDSHQILFLDSKRKLKLDKNSWENYPSLFPLLKRCSFCWLPWNKIWSRLNDKVQFEIIIKLKITQSRCR